ncbi:MAG: hypothetical protein WAS07_15385 [Micropruina sp.]
MSHSSWPSDPPPPHPQQPWPGNYPAPQAPVPWRPQLPTPADERPDPTRALGQQQPASVHIDAFAAPKNHTPLLVTIAALVALALVIVGGIVINAQPRPAPTVSATPTRVSSPDNLPGLPFTSPDGRVSGRWEVLSSRWDSEGVTVQVRVHAVDGTVTYSFMAFANQGATVHDPVPGSSRPELGTGQIAEGDTAIGYLYFEVPREDMTLILATGTGRQMSALVVKA